jgi:hypothetical protein
LPSKHHSLRVQILVDNKETMSNERGKSVNTLEDREPGSEEELDEDLEKETVANKTQMYPPRYHSAEDCTARTPIGHHLFCFRSRSQT